jgi:hypothetical protein
MTRRRRIFLKTFVVGCCYCLVKKFLSVRRLKTAEMKFMRCTTGCSVLDHGRNEDVSEKLKVNPVKKKLSQCKQKWFSHVSRMEDVSYPK